MAYSVSFNLNPIVDSELGGLGSDDTAQDHLMIQHRTESAPEGGIGSPDTQGIELLVKECKDFLDDQTSDVREQADERGLQNSESVQTRLLVRNRWSATTLKVLSSMPSRSIGWQSRLEKVSRCTVHNSQLSRYRRQTPGSSLSTRPIVHRNEDVSEEETKTKELINNLQKLSTAGRFRILRSTPLSLSEKSELRKLAFSDKVGQSLSSEVPYWRKIKRASRHSFFTILSFFSSLRFGRVQLKRIGGRFGTSVLFYFLFLRTLLFFNIFLSLINGLFLVLPQAIYPPLKNTPSRFSGLELLTGTGFLSDSVMFYGYYTNSTINSCGPAAKVRSEDATPHSACGSASETQMIAYNIPLAYSFSTVIAFFITSIALVYSLSKSFGRSVQVLSSHGNLASKIFCSWDFKVSKKTSVRIQSENISTQLKELLLAVNCKRGNGASRWRLTGIAVYPLAWSACLGSTFFFAFGIHVFAEYLHLNKKPEDSWASEAYLLTLPSVVSCGNLFLPGLFNLLSWFENYRLPSVRLYVAIFRNLLLKVSILGVLCYHWLGKVAVQSEGHGPQCWETIVGQELYRFLLMDFIFTVLYTVFGVFLWRMFSQRVLRRKRKPVFDIAWNVLELIYGQTLTWLGVLFCPLLPTVQIIKLLVLFHLKGNSVLMNCQASKKPWRSSHMSTVFIFLLCIPSFLGATAFVIYTAWTIKPSSGCGPFRNLPVMLHSGEQWAHELTKVNPKLAWLNWVYNNVVENPFFLLLVSLVFLMVSYVHAHVLDGQKRIMTLLQEQIENEGKDMKFLITKLQAIHEGEPPLSQSRSAIRGNEVPNQHDTCGL